MQTPFVNMHMDDRIGKQLGNYRLQHLLGQGGFADVYLGEHIHLHTQAAIKILQLRLIENNVESFLNEARTIAHLVHPYIIRVLDFGVQENVPFLVMDYAPKGTFRQRFLHGQPLPPIQLVSFIKQTAAALHYAHERKLIHRDVKPENMLLGPHDEVLLSDFGFALIQSSTSRISAEAAGTAAYMAPEQLQGKPRAASDQYALGIIAYEWLTGRCPFQGTFFEIASQHMLAVPTPLHQTIPSLSPEIENVIMTALAKDPDQRFPTVRDFAFALEHSCLSAQRLHLHEPLVASSATASNHKTSQASATNNMLALADENNTSSLTAQKVFQPLASTIFQSMQPNITTPPGETAMNETSLNRPMSLTSQASQHKTDTIRPSHNAIPSSQISIQPHDKSRHIDDTVNAPASTKVSTVEVEYSFRGAEPFMKQQPYRDERPSTMAYQSTSQTRFNSPLLADEQPQASQQQRLSQPNNVYSSQNFPSQRNSQKAAQSPLEVYRTSQTSMPPRQTARESNNNNWPRARQGTPPGIIVFIIAMAIFIIGGGTGLIYWSNHQSSINSAKQMNINAYQNTLNLSATNSLTPSSTDSTNSITNQNPYVPGASTLVMNDLLSSNDTNSQWQANPQGNCQFSNGSYHAFAAPKLLNTCFATGTNYANFTYEIQMDFIKQAPTYSSGGIIFRGNSDQHQFYLFEVYASGRYVFQKCNGNSNCTILAGSPLSPPAPSYLVDQTNTLAVVANQNTFSFYINHQQVGKQQTDSSNLPYTQGMIGVIAHGGLPPAPQTEVAYSNSKLWQ